MCSSDEAPSSSPSPVPCPCPSFPARCPHPVPRPAGGRSPLDQPRRPSPAVAELPLRPFWEDSRHRPLCQGVAATPASPSVTRQRVPTEVALRCASSWAGFWGSCVPRWAAEGRLLLLGCAGAPRALEGGGFGAWPRLPAPLCARAPGGSLGLLPRPGTLCPSQMSYELWRDLEEESEGEGQGRKPEIGHVFLMDRGGLRPGQRLGQQRGRESPSGAAAGAGGQPGSGSPCRHGLCDSTLLAGGLRGARG